MLYDFFTLQIIVCLLLSFNAIACEIFSVIVRLIKGRGHTPVSWLKAFGETCGFNFSKALELRTSQMWSVLASYV